MLRAGLEEAMGQEPFVAVGKTRKPNLQVSDFMPERPQPLHFRFESFQRQTAVFGHLGEKQHKACSSGSVRSRLHAQSFQLLFQELKGRRRSRAANDALNSASLAAN
jgi:hypothetical protein